LLCACAAFAAEIPKLTARVTDLTGTLHAQQIAALEAKLTALEQRKGSQLVVVVVPTTQPATVEQYAVKLFEVNAIGRKGVDDGVLLLVAKDDRKVRIEVGYGLEGAIPDVYANRIIAEYLTPKFRAGDFYGGIDEATGALAKLIDGETLPEPLAAPKAPAPVMPAAVIIAFWCAVIGMVIDAFGSRRLGFGFLLGALIAAAVSMFFIGSTEGAVTSGVLTLFLGAAMRAQGAGGVSRSGGGSGSSGSSGGWSSSRSSGGGFSGGGGRSGGGGASGSW